MDGPWAERFWFVRMRLSDKQWATSYATQALSDLTVHDLLVRSNAEKCRRLHFLQMATEKTCKAYLTIENGHDMVRKTHACIKKHLPRIAQQFYSTNSNRNQALYQLSEIKRLSHEIELLAPACDDEDVRRDNSEYPWQDANEKIYTPCEYTFPNIDLGSRAIVGLIRLVRTAAESYSR